LIIDYLLLIIERIKMKKPQHKRFTFYLFSFTFLTAVFLQSGCGVVGILGTPGRGERKITAEYDLTKRKDQKILVLVNQPVWGNAQVNLRVRITKAISKNLVEKVKIKPKYVVDYNELSEFRSNRSDFSLLSPTEVGKALDADLVLLVVVEDYQLGELPEAGYYRAIMSVRAVLLDVATGEKLWPKTEKSKNIQVGFEVEQRGKEIAAKRLIAACAHCIVRHLYNCPKNKFKIFDDRSNIGWKSWEK
jgi:hypothetical protein